MAALAEAGSELDLAAAAKLIKTNDRAEQRRGLEYIRKSLQTRFDQDKVIAEVVATGALPRVVE